MIKAIFTRIRVFIQSHIIKPLQVSIIVPSSAPSFDNLVNESHRRLLRIGYEQCIADVRKNIFNAHGMSVVVSEEMKARYGKRT
jgi:hypothetical protein